MQKLSNASFYDQVGEVLKELVITSDGIKKIMEIFTQQMDLANSSDEAKRKQSDLLMENTHVRYLMDGTGKIPWVFVTGLWSSLF